MNSTATNYTRREAANLEAFLADHPEAAAAFDFCLNDPSAWYVAKDIAGKVLQWGSISEKQLAVITGQYERHVNKPAAAELKPALSGRIVITGTILSCKYVESFTGFGCGSYKILLAEDRGFKCYGTLPAAIDGAEKGDRVTMTATLKVSDTDPGFALYSRPVKAEVID
jgi:hypothetical protein